MQTLGETTKAIMEDDTRLLNELVYENRDKRDPYWIVIAAKPSTVKDKLGRFCIMRHFKAHYKKPRPMVGAIIAEVNNVEGKIKWEVNPHDHPFDYERLGLQQDGERKGCKHKQYKKRPAY